MPSLIQRRAVDLADILRSLSARRYAARLISRFLRATHFEVGSGAGGYLCLAFVLLAAGCGYWGRRPIDQLTPLKPHDPVWIWSHDTVRKWQEVVITQDSVSGIPFWTSENCYATCRRSIPRVQVDSMKQGYRTSVQEVTTVTGVAIVVWFVWGEACYLLARGDPEC
jgi:hypothetical protein